MLHYSIPNFSIKIAIIYALIISRVYSLFSKLFLSFELCNLKCLEELWSSKNYILVDRTASKMLFHCCNRDSKYSSCCFVSIGDCSIGVYLVMCKSTCQGPLRAYARFAQL